MSLFNRRKKFKPSEQDLAEMEQVAQHLERMKAGMPPEIVEAHAHCRSNRQEINKSNLCGCFYCLEVFPASEISEWIHGGVTALCPKCGINSVLGDVAGFELDSEFLQAMHRHWF